MIATYSTVPWPASERVLGMGRSSTVRCDGTRRGRHRSNNDGLPPIVSPPCRPSTSRPDVAPGDRDGLRGPRAGAGAGGDRPRHRPPRDRRARIRHAAERRRRRRQARCARATRTTCSRPASPRRARRSPTSSPPRAASRPSPIRSSSRRAPSRSCSSRSSRSWARGRGRPARSELPHLPVMVEFAGGTAVPYVLPIDDDYRLDPAQLEELVTPRTKLAHPQQPRQPDRQHAAARGPRAHRRGRPAPPGLHGAERRGLPGAVVPRRAAGVDRGGRRDDGADDHPRRPLEDLRDDRLARGLGDHAAGDPPAASSGSSSTPCLCTAAFIQHALIEALLGDQSAALAMRDELRARRDRFVPRLQEVPASVPHADRRVLRVRARARHRHGRRHGRRPAARRGGHRLPRRQRVRRLGP